MSEIDDAQKPEDDGEAKAQDCIEGPIDKAHEQLPEKCLHRDTEDHCHCFRPPRLA